MRPLNIDQIIFECNERMHNTLHLKEKEPDAFLEYATARMIKIYLLQKYAEQYQEEFSTIWEDSQLGERCYVCWTPRRIGELNNMCVVCGAKVAGGVNGTV